MEKFLNVIYQLFHSRNEKYVLRYARRARLDKFYWQQKH